jgi:hypothetical protein
MSRDKALSSAEVEFMAHKTSDMAAAADDAALRECLARLDAAMAACEALDDPDLARRAGRKLLAAVACAADALLRDGAKTLHAAPDKVAAFFDKSAAAFVQAIEGLHKRAALIDVAALEAKEIAPARPRAADPLANAIAAWSSPVIPPPRSGGGEGGDCPEIVPRAQRST